MAELADKGDFLDATFLLLHGELPDKKEKERFAKVRRFWPSRRCAAVP